MQGLELELVLFAYSDPYGLQVPGSPTHGRKDGQTDEWTHRRMDARTNGGF